MHDDIKRELRLLVILSLEGQITDAQRQSLNDLLRSNPQALDYYLELVEMHQALQSCDWRIEYERLCSLQRALEEFAADERTSPEVKPVTQDVQADIVCSVEHPQSVRKISRGSWFTLAATAAAIVLFFMFVYIVPTADYEVAVVSDSIDAKWLSTDSRMDRDAPVSTGRRSLVLQEGYVKFQFFNNAHVVIEGPAEFQIRTEDQIKLRYGKLYAIIPQEAIGFSVYTGNAKIIDLGTEFGVQADISGDTSLYVMQGSTTLIAGEKSQKGSVEVQMGAAKRVYANVQDISNITFKPDYFARNINSQSNVVWRGENVKLTSIVAGLDGFQEVDSLTVLDPVKGEHTTSISSAWRRSNKMYNPVPDTKFIDGVFVPDKESAVIQITSSGQTFNGPATCGEFTHNIAVYKGSIGHEGTTIPPLFIHGQEVVNDPVLVLHSNVGITFDLQAIRESLPQLDLKSFKATGVPMKEYTPDIDFCVLVDGQVKYERKTDTTNRGRDPIPFAVEFNPADRFLTLIVTDGATDSYASDFFYLIKPELCMTASMKK